MWRIRSFFKGLHNFWYFRKEIWNFREWDYSFQLRLWRRSLIPLRDSIQKGDEEEVSRNKKATAILEAIMLIDFILKDDYMTTAEQELGITFLDTKDASEASKVINLSNKLAERDWKRLWRILEGQNHNEYVMLLDRQNIQSQFEDAHDDLWAKWFDGTGMNGWWD